MKTDIAYRRWWKSCKIQTNKQTKNQQSDNGIITYIFLYAMRTIVRFNDDSIQNNTNENIRFCGLIKSFELFGRKINAVTDGRKKKSEKKNWTEWGIESVFVCDARQNNEQSN